MGRIRGGIVVDGPVMACDSIGVGLSSRVDLAGVLEGVKWLT